MKSKIRTAVSQLGMCLHLQASVARNRHFVMSSELGPGPRKRGWTSGHTGENKTFQGSYGVPGKGGSSTVRSAPGTVLGICGAIVSRRYWVQLCANMALSPDVIDTEKGGWSGLESQHRLSEWDIPADD